jgi:hypothetical protein
MIDSFPMHMAAATWPARRQSARRGQSGISRVQKRNRGKEPEGLDQKNAVKLVQSEMSSDNTE